VLRRSFFGVLGAVLAAAIIVGVVASYNAIRGPRTQVASQSAAGTPAGPSQGQLKEASAAPVATPSATASESAVPVMPAAGHTDPFGTAATGYLATRTGTVLAAVYDVKTGQTWRLGEGGPQAEASVVKLDVLETLLAQRARSTGLSASDR
jgi:hypothetical protein